MKRLGISAILACLLLNGCMDLNMKIHITSDWSTTIALRMEMLDQNFQLLSTQMKQTGSTLSLFDEDAFRGKITEVGGKVNRFSNTMEQGIRTLDVEMWFPDGRNTLASMGQGQMSLRQEDDGWIWQFLDGSMTKAFREMEPEQLEQQFGMMMPMMSGLSWKIDFKVPRIVDSNLEKVDADTVRFQLNFDSDIAGKETKEAIELFLRMMEPKWVKFVGMP